MPVTEPAGEDCLSGTRSGRLYRERVARSFSRIRRCGADTKSFHWEVTDKQGTVFIYGRSAGARLQDSASGDIAEWMLERVVDRSGNATLFDYAPDGRGTAPADGPFARNNFQNWRRLYPQAIHYSAKVTSPFATPADAAYRVSFLQEGQVKVTDSPTERPDVITSGRTGFKVSTRFRLKAVRVELLTGEDRGVIREYALDYEQEHQTGASAFGRSLLTAIRVKGAGPKGSEAAGPEFYAHQLDYYRSTAAERSFSAPTAWSFEGSGRPADAQALSDSKEQSTRDGTFVGLAPPALAIKALSSGRSWGSTHGERRTLSTLVDVNGDGLPDRVRGDEVRFNQSMPVPTAAGGFQRTFRFAPRAPYGDPAASSPVAFNGGQSLDLVREALEGEDSAWETHFPSGQGSLGQTMLRSDALRVLMDADGDGRVDLVSGRGVLFSKERRADCSPSDPDCCPAGDICFRRDVLGALTAAGDTLSEDPLLREMARRREARSYPTDAVVRWLAPTTGRVELSGTFRKLRTAPEGGDGVQLQVFRQATGDAPVLLATFSAGPMDTSVKSLALPTIDVLAGDAVFFKLSTGVDVPLGREGTRDVGLDEVSLEPELRYTSFCSTRGGGCQPVPTAVAGAADPSGHSLVRYTLKDDLRVAGSPWMGVQIPVQAEVTLGGIVTKRPTADDVTVCLQQFAAGQAVGNRPCGPGDVVHRFAWNASESVPVSVTRRVAPSTQVVFRVESETPVDPGSITWRSSVKYLALCPMDGGACQNLSAEEQARLDKQVEPLYSIHTPVLDGAPRVYVVPRSGRAVLSSGLLALPGAGPIQVVIHRGSERLLKAAGTHSRAVELNVNAGELLTVRAYSGKQESYAWSVRLRFPGAGPEGSDLTYDVRELNRAVQSSHMPFSGGYRGFGVGEWNGREAFDPRRIAAFNPDDWEGLSEEEMMKRVQERLADPDSPESRSLELFSPLLPRQYPSELNEGPAWTSVAGLAFVAPGRAHAARKQSHLPSEAGHDPRSRDLDGVVRTSINEGDGINLGLSTPYFGLGLAGSLGPTTSVMESLDMNGDGLVDAVSSGSVRLSRPGDFAAEQPFPLGGPLRRSKGFSLMFSPSSGGLPQEQGNSGGTPRQVSATDIISAVAGLAIGQHSLGVGRDEGEHDLIDVNGDGLPDRVARTEGQQFQVWLNLGTRFAEQADVLPAAEWQTPVDSFFFNGVQQEIREGIKKVVPGLEWPKVTRTSALRHTTTMTMLSSWGLTFGIGSGASAGISYQGSVARTSVDLMDVNGDGLPDLVKKGAFDGGLHVQLNEGHGFAPEEEWPMPSWGGIPGPKLRFVIDNRNLSDALLSLGVGRRGEVDGLAMSASYSDPNSWALSGGVGLNISFLCIFCPAVVVEKSYSDSQSRSGFEIGLQDLDGDGALDHVLKNSDTPDVIYARMGNLSASPVGLLKSVVRPLGGSFEVSYARVGNTVALPHSRWVMKEVVLRDGRGGTGTELVTGHDLRTTYRYEDGYYDRTEKEFYGFARFIRQSGDGTTGGDGRQVEQLYRNDDYSLRGLLVKETLRDKDGRVFHVTTHDYVDVSLGAAPAPCLDRLPHPLFTQRQACTLEFPQLVTTTEEFCEGGGACVSSTQRFGYDPLYGNVTHFEDLGEAGSGDDLISDITYPRSGSALAGRYIVGVPLEVTVKDRGGQLLRYRQGDYDEQGLLRVFTTRIDASQSAVTNLDWTPSGNPLRVQGPPNEAGQRYVVEYGYDTLTDTYVTGTVDSFELSSSVEYDPRFGIPRRTTDANGNVNVQVIDSFGRVTDVYGPYDVGTQRPTLHFEYRPGASPASALTEHKLPPGEAGAKPTLDTILFVDGLKRMLQTKKDAELHLAGKGFAVSGKVVFDLAGRVTEQGQTTFAQGDRWAFVNNSLKYPTSTAYDVLDRVLQTRSADGTVTVMQYALMPLPDGGTARKATRITDGNGHVRVTFRDVSDRVLAVEEHIAQRRPTTSYEYNALGEVTAIIDAEGHRTEVGYDLVGRKVRLDSKDAGLQEYVYDKAGNLVARWDANLRLGGEPVRFRYDFNRLSVIDYPRSEDVRYFYGGKGSRQENDAGRIREVQDEAGRELRTYGRLGELVETTRVLRPLRPGDRHRAFTTRFETDSFGRALSIRYPDGEVVRYAYDAGGLLKSAVGERPATPKRPAEREVYLASLKYDVFGQRVRMVLGNGVVTEYGYEPETRRLENLRTTTPSGRRLQAIAYRYDRVGNVKSLTNALGAPVGSQSGAVSLTFEYDALDRLTLATGSALSRPGVEDRFRSVFEYSDIHNLTRKQQVRELIRSVSGGATVERPDRTNHDDTYLYEGVGPHQATRIGDTLLAYDANGNTLSECRSPQGLPCDTGGPGEVPGGDVSQTHLRRYVWNEDNRLSAAVDGGGRNLTRFLYDAAGDRVVKLGQGGPSVTMGQFFSLKGRQYATKHIFAGTTRIASKVLPPPDGRVGVGNDPGGTPPGQVGNEHGCEPSNYQPNKCPVPVADPSSGVVETGTLRPATYYYHADHLGSSSWVTDAAARVSEHVEYFPYGEVWREERGDSPGQDKVEPTFRFTGKPFDEETGLTYFGARYYDARKARWLSPDPAMLMQGMEGVSAGLSTYSYSYHSPVALKDPDGLMPAASDAADAWEVNRGLYREWLASQITPETTKDEMLDLALLTLSVELGAGLVDLARFGEGAAEGGWKGYATDTLRAVGIATMLWGLRPSSQGSASSNTGALLRSCFVRGTLVQTPEGVKPIEDIREGDKVLAFDVQEQRLVTREVLHIFVAESDHTVTVETAGILLHTTAWHPFWVVGSGWVRAAELAEGDALLAMDGSHVQVRRVAVEGSRARVYNLEVQGEQNYFVSLQGLLVHNKAMAASEVVDHIVLGLRNYGLEATAAKVGGRTLLSDPNWRQSLLQAISDPKTKFSVSVDGLSGGSTYQKIMRAAQQGATPNATPTNWEIAQLREAGKLKDATFLENGVEIDNPFQ